MCPKLDSARLRDLVVDANDGIVATAGIVEGFIGAGAEATTTLIAAFTSMIAGGIALGGAKFAEAAVERDAHASLIEEERRQLAMSPEEERAELAAIYEESGLSPELAEQVATELSEHNALAAHAMIEHGIDLDRPPTRPVVAALAGGVAFALGSVVVLATVLLTPRPTVGLTTFLAVAVSLSLTSLVLARWGKVPVGRTMVRTVGTGIAAMAVTFALGSLFAL